MKVQDKVLRALVIVFAMLVFINIVTIVALGKAFDKPTTSVSTEVLGAVFAPVAEPNVVNVNLVRPPRKVVNPGDAVEENMTITNTAEFSIYFRTKCIVRVDDADGNEIKSFKPMVKVNMSEDWECKDGYWYYMKAVEPGETIVGPVDSIVYSDAFADHRDYKIYVPMIVESVEAMGIGIEEVNCWPNKNINEVDYKRLNEPAEWTTSTKIIIG